MLGAVAGLLLSTAAAASADTNLVLPDSTRDGFSSITIYKYVNDDPTRGVNDGLPKTPEQLGQNTVAIEGVEYTIERVLKYDVNNDGLDNDPVIDLTTREGWALAAGLAEMVKDWSERDWQDNAGRFAFGDAGVVKTEADGKAEFSRLDLGLYRVTETDWPLGADIDDDGVRDDVVPPARPFVVTVPMTHPTKRDSWMYDLHVYPKNDTMSLVKDIVDEDAVSVVDDGYVTFDVWTTLPLDVTDMESLTFTDALDPRLSFAFEEGGVDNFWFLPSETPGRPGDGNVGTVQFVDNTLTVKYENDFLVDHAGHEVGFRFRAKVAGFDGNGGIGDGIITNVANYVIETPGGKTTGESNEVQTKWGGINLVKKASDSGDLLDGVKFQVYVDVDKDGILDATDELVSVNGQDTWVTEDGSLVINGLRYSNYENDVELIGDPTTVDPQANPDWRQYLLVETETVLGYELLAEPIPFYVTSDAGTHKIEVVNVPHNAGFELPAVGGNRAVLPIVAAVIAASGVVWLIRSRREQQA